MLFKKIWGWSRNKWIDLIKMLNTFIYYLYLWRKIYIFKRNDARSQNIAYWVHIAYWVKHFPQHHLSGSGIAQLEFYHGREQELCPWQRSWGRRLGTCKGGIEPQESPWKFSSIYPQTRVCLLSALCSHLHLWLYRGCPPLPLSEKRVSLQLQLIIPGCDSV